MEWYFDTESHGLKYMKNNGTGLFITGAVPRTSRSQSLSHLVVVGSMRATGVVYGIMRYTTGHVKKAGRVRFTAMLGLDSC